MSCPRSSSHYGRERCQTDFPIKAHSFRLQSRINRTALVASTIIVEHSHVHLSNWGEGDMQRAQPMNWQMKIYEKTYLKLAAKAKAIKMNLAISSRLKTLKVFYSTSSFFSLAGKLLSFASLHLEHRRIRESEQFKVPLSSWGLSVIAFKCTTLIQDQLREFSSVSLSACRACDSVDAVKKAPRWHETVYTELYEI